MSIWKLRIGKIKRKNYLYKAKEDIIHEAVILKRKPTDNIKIDFYSDCGKFATHESLAGYNLTPERLLEILHEREDITDNEIF